MTQISGKLVDDTAVQGEGVTIELPQVDKSKIKAGDEVWIRVTTNMGEDEGKVAGEV